MTDKIFAVADFDYNDRNHKLFTSELDEVDGIANQHEDIALVVIDVAKVAQEFLDFQPKID